MSSTTKRPSMDPRQEPRAPAQPWGQKILRDRAMALLRSGSPAPSVVLGNLLAASANPVLDEEALSAPPRPLGSQASQVVSAAMAKLRLPHADAAAILDELMKMAWTPKTSSAREASKPAAKPAPKTSGRSAGKSFAKPAPKKVAKPVAPTVIVRKATKAPREE